MYNLRGMMTIKLISITILLLFASVSISYSATSYYVRTDGNDSCNGTD